MKSQFNSSFMGRSSEEFIKQREEVDSIPPYVIDDIWRNYFEYINQIKSSNEKEYLIVTLTSYVEK